MLVSTAVGATIGGPVVEGIGAAETLTASGIATVVLAAAASILWPRVKDGATGRSAVAEVAASER